MNRKKIRLSTPEMVSEFINVCSKYECDINLYDGSISLDAKSIVAMFGIMQGKVIEVQAISSDESVILRFIEDMRKFEV
ncbi:MAG: HPr family phosphocarrier protein [Lachnospiraceae bacterium]|nr:HPr family phosphocarrier protein [Lachnospiraceae bacterium]